jgi:hypothetical protein
MRKIMKKLKPFGIAGSPPEAKGLIEFKERWGAEREDFNLYTRKTNLFRLVQTIYRARNSVSAIHGIKRGKTLHDKKI